MLKKSDIAPAILALVSTTIVMLLGLIWFNKIKSNNSQQAKLQQQSFPQLTQNKATADSPNSSFTTTQSRNSLSNSRLFAAPHLVSQGTSVRINGSTKMIPINQALKKSFQRRFPGTEILIEADGSETGIDILSTGDTDIAAIVRSLTESEKAAGLAMVTVDEIVYNQEDATVAEVFYYAYRQPASIEVEAFLGFALSAQGQKAIAK